VEEIERELLEGCGDSNSATAPSNHISEPVSTLQSKPKVIRAEDLERELFESSPSVAPKTHESKQVQLLELMQMQQHQQQQQIRPQFPPHMIHRMEEPHAHVTHLRAPLPPNFVHPNNISNGVHPGMNTPSAFTPHPMMLANARIPSPPSNMRHPGKPNMIHPNALNHSMLRGHGMPPRHMGMPLPMSPMQQQRLHLMQMRGGRPPFGMPFPMPPRPGHPGMIPPGMPHLGPMGPDPNFRNHPHHMYGMRIEDPFRGLMNQKDKQRLRNIQIIQLQNDHPYTTDYYFLVRFIKIYF